MDFSLWTFDVTLMYFGENDNHLIWWKMRLMCCICEYLVQFQRVYKLVIKILFAAGRNLITLYLLLLTTLKTTGMWVSRFLQLPHQPLFTI